LSDHLLFILNDLLKVSGESKIIDSKTENLIKILTLFPLAWKSHENIKNIMRYYFFNPSPNIQQAYEDISFFRKGLNSEELNRPTVLTPSFLLSQLQYFPHMSEEAEFIVRSMFFEKSYAFQPNPPSIPEIQKNNLLSDNPSVVSHFGNSKLAQKQIHQAIKQHSDPLAFAREYAKNAIEHGGLEFHADMYKSSNGMILTMKDNGTGMDLDSIESFKIPTKSSKDIDLNDPNFGWGAFTAFQYFSELYLITGLGTPAQIHLRLSKTSKGDDFREQQWIEIHPELMEKMKNWSEKQKLNAKQLLIYPPSHPQFKEYFDKLPLDKAQKVQLWIESKKYNFSPGSTFHFERHQDNVSNIHATLLASAFFSNLKYFPDLKIYLNSHRVNDPNLQKKDIKFSYPVSIKEPKTDHDIKIMINFGDSAGLYRNGLKVSSNALKYYKAIPKQFQHLLEKAKLKLSISFPKDIPENMNRDALKLTNKQTSDIENMVFLTSFRLIHQLLISGQLPWEDIAPNDFLYDFSRGQHFGKGAYLENAELIDNPDQLYTNPQVQQMLGTLRNLSSDDLFDLMQDIDNAYLRNIRDSFEFILSYPQLNEEEFSLDWQAPTIVWGDDLGITGEEQDNLVKQAMIDQGWLSPIGGSFYAVNKEKQETPLDVKFPDEFQKEEDPMDIYKEYINDSSPEVEVWGGHGSCWMAEA